MHICSIRVSVLPLMLKWNNPFSKLAEQLEWSESETRSVMSDSLWTHGLYSPWNSLGQNTGVGSFSLLQGIFPTQGSNPGLLHCRRILYQLSHKGSPRSLNGGMVPHDKIELVSHSVVSNSVTPWTIAHQAPLFMEFFRQECWSGLPFPSPITWVHFGMRTKN